MDLFNNDITKNLMNGILLTDSKEDCYMKIKMNKKEFRENRILSSDQEDEFSAIHTMCNFFIQDNWPLVTDTYYLSIDSFINTIPDGATYDEAKRSVTIFLSSEGENNFYLSFFIISFYALVFFHIFLFYILFLFYIRCEYFIRTKIQLRKQKSLLNY
jgi:hypothetical protein